MINTDSLEVLAVVPLPCAPERRRREIMLARVMLVPIRRRACGRSHGPGDASCDAITRISPN